MRYLFEAFKSENTGAVFYILGVPPMEGMGMPVPGAAAPPPPTDGASDHPDQFVPEAVRNFLPVFYIKFKEKVRSLFDKGFALFLNLWNYCRV